MGWLGLRWLVSVGWRGWLGWLHVFSRSRKDQSHRQPVSPQECLTSRFKYSYRQPVSPPARLTPRLLQSHRQLVSPLDCLKSSSNSLTASPSNISILILSHNIIFSPAHISIRKVAPSSCLTARMFHISIPIVSPPASLTASPSHRQDVLPVNSISLTATPSHRQERNAESPHQCGTPATLVCLSCRRG